MFRDEYPPNYEVPENVSSPADLTDELRENMVEYFIGKPV